MLVSLNNDVSWQLLMSVFTETKNRAVSKYTHFEYVEFLFSNSFPKFSRMFFDFFGSHKGKSVKN